MLTYSDFESVFFQLQTLFPYICDLEIYHLNKRSEDMALQKNNWQIECNHTPETIDRVLLPIRKRGICVSKMSYEQKDAINAVCTVEFEVDSSDVERVYKNMLRLHDIQNVVRLS